MTLTRAQKRVAKRFHEKKAMTGKWSEKLKDDTEGFKQNLESQGRSSKSVLFFGSNDVLSIQVFSMENMTLMGFRRNTEGKDFPWAVKMHFKELLGFGDQWGYECYPSKNELVDDANMYWIMIPKKAIPEMDFKKYNLFPARL